MSRESPSALPRIGIVMPLAEQRGGAELALLHLLRGLGPDRRDAIRLCFLEAGPMVQEALELGYVVDVLPAGRLRQLGAYLGSVRALAAWIRRNRLQVVLSWLSKAHLYVAPAAKMTGIAAVWWQHGLPRRLGVDQIATLLPATCILACSHAAARAQRALPANKLEPVVIHPPADLDAFKRLAATPLTRQALDLPLDATIVGIVARLQRWKGVHLVIEAVARLRRTDPSVYLLVVGGPHAQEPDYAAQLQAQCLRLGMQSAVRFLGQRNDVPACMGLMDVVVNASDGEPFGMVIVEAMGLGKAVVAPRAEGPLEIVTDGLDGVLFAPGDVSDLAEVLHGILRDPQARAVLGAAAQRRAAGFSIPPFVEKLTQALTAVAAS